MPSFLRARRETEDDLALLTAIAQYVWEDRMPQKDIPPRVEAEFGHKLSASTVSRLLARAQELDILQVFVKPPRHLHLQNTLRKQLASKHVHTVRVVPTGGGRKNEENLGRVGAEELLATIQGIERPHIKITISAGTTLRRVLTSFFRLLSPSVVYELRKKRFELCPAFLVDAPGIGHYHPHTLLAGFGIALREELDPNLIDDYVVQATILTLPPHFYSLEESVRRTFLATFSQMEATITEAKTADIFLLGIGSLQHYGQEDADYQALMARLDPLLQTSTHSYVADSLFIPFEASGAVHQMVQEKIVGVGIDELRTLKEHPEKRIIAVAGGADKCQAVQAALAEPYFNVLVIDEEVAIYLVEQA